MGPLVPWNADDPSSTPLAAEYQFSNADLGVFDGIEGTLESTGAFKGVLNRIVVDGRASVPAFALSDVKQPVRLETTFHSIVDGTSGDTLLEPVDGDVSSDEDSRHGRSRRARGRERTDGHARRGDERGAPRGCAPPRGEEP
jgi:hypothetical protein